jgi:TolB protein
MRTLDQRLLVALLSRREMLCAAGVFVATSIVSAQAAAPRKEQPMPIALPDFVAGTAADAEVARNITAVITANLKGSGLFAPIDPASYVEKIISADALPRFPDWRTINAQALVTGRLAREPDGRYQTDFRLWDVTAGQHLVGQRFSAPPERWRRIGHLISDTVYERLTGQKGYFDKGDD